MKIPTKHSGKNGMSGTKETISQKEIKHLFSTISNSN
jgi:hypothetical protein